MSEETPKITTEKKGKDPRHVEVGKRLAAISKSARENTMREKIEMEKNHESQESSLGINYGYVIGTLGVILAGVTLYYIRNDDQRETKLENNEPHLEKKHVEIAF